jgi:hypothetical protein
MSSQSLFGFGSLESGVGTFEFESLTFEPATISKYEGQTLCLSSVPIAPNGPPRGAPTPPDQINEPPTHFA